MPIAFVLDENLRGKPIWHAIRRQTSGSAGHRRDPDWRPSRPSTRLFGCRHSRLGGACESNYPYARRGDIPCRTDGAPSRGHASPSIFVIRPKSAITMVLAWLQLVATDDQPNQWRDQVFYIP